MKNKYSIFSLIKNAFSYHENWQKAWKDPVIKKEYDAIIVGGGGHGLATAYYLAKKHNMKNIAVVEKGWIGGGNTGRNTTIIRSNYLWDASAGLYDHALKLWEGLSQEINYNVMFSQRGVMNLAHNLQDIRDLKRRTHANRLNGIDAVYLSTEEVKKFCPIINMESGRIDHAHHAGNAYNALHDAVAFSDAVQAVVDKVDLDETLILVTADHSHVFTIAGYPTKGNPILGKVVTNDGAGAPEAAPTGDADGNAYTTLGYTNGLGYADLGAETDADARYASAPLSGRQDLSGVDTETPGYHQEALVPMGSETHAGEDISLHAIGADSWLVQGNMEQNALFHIMTRATALTPAE